MRGWRAGRGGFSAHPWEPGPRKFPSVATPHWWPGQALAVQGRSEVKGHRKGQAAAGEADQEEPSPRGETDPPEPSWKDSGSESVCPGILSISERSVEGTTLVLKLFGIGGLFSYWLKTRYALLEARVKSPCLFFGLLLHRGKVRSWKMRASRLGLTPTSICQGLGRAGPGSTR